MVIEKHGLRLESTKGMPREVWLAKRKEGLGGSDMGTLLGVNKNFSKLELFYQKCGATLDTTENNPAMHWGNQNEKAVLHNAQYLNLETQEYLAAYDADQKVRKTSEFKYMVINPEFPWLIANIDGLIGFNKRKFVADGIAEIKTISRQSAELWESFPPYHYFQVQMYSTVLKPMLTPADASAIFYLKDGRDFYGYPISHSVEVAKRIVEDSHTFWQLVLKGKEIVQNTPDKQKQLQFLAQIEPDPETNEAYMKFISKLYALKSEFIRIDGTDDLYEHAKAYKAYNKEISQLINTRDVHKTEIMNTLRYNDANIIDFKEKGRITYNQKLYINVN